MDKVKYNVEKVWSDVTEQLEYIGMIDGYQMAIKCLCGYGDYCWKFVAGDEKDYASFCPECGRQYYYTADVKVFCKEDTKNE